MWKPYLGEDHHCVAFGEEDPRVFLFNYTYIVRRELTPISTVARYALLWLLYTSVNDIVIERKGYREKRHHS